MLGAEEQTGSTYCTKAAAPTRRSVNMVLNVHRNHQAYFKDVESGGKGVWRLGGEGVYIPIATLSPPE